MLWLLLNFLYLWLIISCKSKRERPAFGQKMNTFLLVHILQLRGPSTRNALCGPLAVASYDCHKQEPRYTQCQAGQCLHMSLLHLHEHKMLYSRKEDLAALQKRSYQNTPYIHVHVYGLSPQTSEIMLPFFACTCFLLSCY